MIKRVSIIVLTVILFLSSSVNVLACNEEQSNSYVSKILFGDQAIRYETDKNVETLLSALYICSEQSNKDGQDKLNVLKKANVRRLPKIADINVSSDELLECSHNNWKYETKNLKEEQQSRKKVLKDTVIKTFDFGWFNEIFKKDSGQIDSFSALLYYSHLLADYLADDPANTEISVKGIDVPSYSGIPTVEINGNIPSFTATEKRVSRSYKEYSDFDAYKRCGAAISNIGLDTLSSNPVRDNSAISKVYPTGWEKGNKTYEGILAAELYNRCHLVAHQLGGADTQWNLITGTRYLNENMIKYEDIVANYIKSTGNHVLYRATPVYSGDNLVASGVQLEGYSIEDKGQGVSFNVYLYNVQPGVNIDYANGSSERADEIFGKDNVLPFATMNPSGKNPDLMFEISKQLEILFEDQKNSSDYKVMMDELERIADEARSVSGDKEWKVYSELKKYQYEYVEKLSEYVPKLLSNEKFFNSVFK